MGPDGRVAVAVALAIPKHSRCQILASPITLRCVYTVENDKAFAKGATVNMNKSTDFSTKALIHRRIHN
ncbi:hypothetical protein CEXT_287301 [Caerostris extrusa]|uniref:Uncharacterized protein n=1 Tax=Caerostris extrusa TaxID=172846 RepID=A0AAV4M5W8_CAEEX|nr:hypothetical protein CEXT_287301 [Caerostris extrusa]